MKPKPTILIIEDEYIIADQIKNCIEQEGYHVCEIIDNYTDAVNAIERFLPDLVIADIRLYDDYDAGIRVGEYIGARYSIPIVYLSGYSDQETLIKAKKTNPSTFLIKPKPLDKGQLMATIQMAVPQVNNPFDKLLYLNFKSRKFISSEENREKIQNNDLIQYRIKLQDIYLIESFNHVIKNTIVIRVLNGNISYLIREEIENIIQYLPSYFLRVHKSYIISKLHINGINAPNYLVVNNREIPVGQKFKDCFEAI